MQFKSVAVQSLMKTVQVAYCEFTLEVPDILKSPKAASLDLCWPGTLFPGSRNVSNVPNVPNVPNNVPNIPGHVLDMWPRSACSGSTLAQASSAHACSALASDPNANKARGAALPLALNGFGSSANAEHA